jgi:hypothetical protein
MDNIFIQIASYRDPELLPTIRNCIQNAEFPENLKFCIGWQRDTNDSLEEYTNDPRFIILSIPFKETKGCCWMRNKIQKFYGGEKYTLQLDSHHRFIKGWDTTLINMLTDLQKKGHNKPLITAYVPSYNPENDPEERVLAPWKINFDRATHDGQILFIPSHIDNFKELSEPIQAHFYSAHFAFTLGIFCNEVQHDPKLYFTGEEMNITIRAFTHGYDLFHPHIVIVWHEYTRKNRTKHWDDDKEWWKKDFSSKDHYKTFIENIKKIDPNNRYGLGKERNIEDYSNYHLLDKDRITFSIKEIEYKKMDESWIKWIKENVDLKITKQIINDVLLKANFDPSDIEKELSHFF